MQRWGTDRLLFLLQERWGQTPRVAPWLGWPEDPRGLDRTEIATRISQVYEELIRRHPELYSWLHDRYRSTPPTWDARERTQAKGLEHLFPPTDLE